MAGETKAMLGHKVRRLRRDQGLTQSEMAERIGISASYLNLIEHNQRPVTVPLLFKLGQAFEIDLKDFAEDEEARLATALREVFRDPVFEGQAVAEREIRDLTQASPAAAEAVLGLYDAYRELREQAGAMAHRLSERDLGAPVDAGSSPVDAVREWQEANANHVPGLEAAAEALWQDADLNPDSLFADLSRHLRDAHQISVRLLPVQVMEDTLRRFDYHRRRILLSQRLPLSGRVFQLGVQLALIGRREELDRIVGEANLANPQAESLLRITLANYFAGAVMMPYERILGAARDCGYDLDMLRQQFFASFEQVAHRLTTLQRPGSRGVRFFFIRIDKAGNVSKRLSVSPFPFARFGGTCPKWIVHDAFATPGHIRTQLAEMPDGIVTFTIARTIDPLGGWRVDQPEYAIGLGCEGKDADQLVYARDLDLARGPRVPIGVACRVCERIECLQRAAPPINYRLRIDENARRLAPLTYAPGG